MAKKKTVVQRHHISYNPEWVGTVYLKEHNVLDGRMGMNRWKTVSVFFLDALEDFIVKHRRTAIDLDVKI